MENNICVLVPTLNEEATIGSVVSELQEYGFGDILVMDGGSTDETVARARESGAKVAVQSGSGKGQAVREAMNEHIDAEIVLMLDGDGTYDPADAEKLIEPIQQGRAQHVIGNRFADMHPGAMSRLNKFGNRLINKTFTVAHGSNYTDILSGYRAFTADAWRKMQVGHYNHSLALIDSDGFAVETEMAVEARRQRISTEVVPISYRSRHEEGQTNLHPVRDGFVILTILFRLAKINHPFVYFGTASLASVSLGGVMALYVGVEWITRNVSHEVIAILAAFFILFGSQLFLFGLLADLMVRLHREQRNRIGELREN